MNYVVVVEVDLGGRTGFTVAEVPQARSSFEACDRIMSTGGDYLHMQNLNVLQGIAIPTKEQGVLH